MSSTCYDDILDKRQFCLSSIVFFLFFLCVQMFVDSSVGSEGTPVVIRKLQE